MTLRDFGLPRYGLRRYLTVVFLVGPFEAVELWMAFLGLALGAWIATPGIDALHSAPGYRHMLLVPPLLWGLAFLGGGATALLGALAAVPVPQEPPATSAEATGDAVLAVARWLAQAFGGVRRCRRIGAMGLAMLWLAASAAVVTVNWRFLSTVVFPFFAAACLFVYMRVGRSAEAIARSATG